MDISFVIITGGKKPKHIERLLSSIKKQDIKNCESIIVGATENLSIDLFSLGLSSPKSNVIKTIEKKQAAQKGELGVMRNAGCKEAKFDNIVILDDDLLLTEEWYKNLLNFKEEYDILTCQVRVPDGGRYWDHACYQSPKNGHITLEADQQDDYLYMSGGCSWLMKKHVFDKIQYDSSEIYNMSNLKDYAEGKHNEDTYFAQRCRHSGFKIKHNHSSVSFHDDPTYTNLGRYARRRENGRTQEWVKSMDLDFPPEVIVQFSAALYNSNFPAEAADVLRMGLRRHIKNQTLEENWKKLSDAHGGELSDARWSMDGDPLFLKTINWAEE
ncbi:hypothetical protein CMI37_25410 [Candidatus Pacearchaeota archaeon]|nr:hypothetical protein [Candidatus Pacearchaeota archaeon]|tara:strand:- start:87 stop:1067 length:981 start_codon:yes stop_codon:yes gene_type:complete